MLQEVEASSPDLIEALTAEHMPVEDLSKPGRRFWRFIVDGQTVGFAGLETYDTAALLRSVVLRPSYKGHGYGARIVTATIDEAHKAGVTQLWLLTKTAAPFFELMGWQRRERTDAPAKIAASDEFTGLCPSSATCMSYGLVHD